VRLLTRFGLQARRYIAAMNCYEIWADLAPGVKDLDFVGHAEAYLGRIVSMGLMERFRIRRRKLGFGPDGLGEWNLSLEFRDLRQLEDAFDVIAKRSGEIEQLHHEVYSRISGARFGLYRDFPGAERE
jgi:hypothetical protein